MYGPDDEEATADFSKKSRLERTCVETSQPFQAPESLETLTDLEIDRTRAFSGGVL